MKVTPGALFATLRGKHQDIVVRSTQAGHVVAPHVPPKNPKTAAQVAVRTAFSAATSAYGNLAPDQQAGWDALGASTMVTNNVGATFTLSGQQAHVSVNATLAAAGQPTLANAPAKVAPPVLPPSTLTCTLANGQPSLVVHPAQQYAGLVVIYGTKPLGKGTKSPSKSTYRKIAVTNALMPAGYDVTTAYVNKFGAPPAGSKVGIKLVPVSASGHSGLTVIDLATTTGQ